MKIGKPTPKWQLVLDRNWPTSVAFLGDGNRIAAGNRRGEIYVWELPDDSASLQNAAKEENEKDKRTEEDGVPDFAPTLRLDGHANAITHLRCLPDGRTLVSSSLDHTVRLWDTKQTPTDQAEVVLDAKRREQQARNKPQPERERIVDAPGVTVSTIASSHTLKGHRDWVRALGISGDGKRIISGDDTCLSIVWDVDSRKIISQWQGYDRVWVRSAALSPAGETAFTCEYAGSRSSFDRPAAQARLWNADDGSLQLDLLKVWTPKVKDKDRVDSYGYAQKWGKLLKRGLVCADFSPDGTLLAVGQGGETDTGKVHLVDVASGKIVRTVSGHRYGVCDVRFSADGRFVLSSGRDTTVRICQVDDGKEVAVLGKPRGGQFKDWLHAIAISPDQQTVAAADIGGYIHVWSLNTK